MKIGNDNMDIGRLVESDTGIFGRKSACSEGPECMRQRIEEGHSANHKKDRLDHRQPKIYQPQVFCGSRNSGRDLVHRRSRSLRLHKLETAGTQQGKNGNSQNDDTHTAEQWVRERQKRRL